MDDREFQKILYSEFGVTEIVYIDDPDDRYRFICNLTAMVPSKKSYISHFEGCTLIAKELMFIKEPKRSDIVHKLSPLIYSRFPETEYDIPKLIEYASMASDKLSFVMKFIKYRFTIKQITRLLAILVKYPDKVIYENLDNIYKACSVQTWESTEEDILQIIEYILSRNIEDISYKLYYMRRLCSMSQSLRGYSELFKELCETSDDELEKIINNEIKTRLHMHEIISIIKMNRLHNV